MSRRNMIILGVCGLAVLVGGLLNGFAISSRWDELSALEKEKQSLEAMAAGTGVARRVAHLRAQAAATNVVLPAEVKVGPLLSGIGDDLAQLGVSDRSLTMAEPTMLGRIQQVPLNLTFKGSFESVFYLLDRLSRYEQAIRVQRLTISRDSGGSDEALSVTARLATFAHDDEEVR